MKQTLRYARRYLVLLPLALVLVPLNFWLAGRATTAQVAYQTSDSAGQNYTSPTTAFYDVALLSDRNGWAVGGNFQITHNPGGGVLNRLPATGFIWRLQGENWGEFQTTDQPLLSLVLTSSHDGWAVGYEGGLWHFDGQDWKKTGSPVHTTLRAIAALNEHDIWAVGFLGTILHYDGTSWSSVPGPSSVDLRSVSMLSASDGWIVGDRGLILHYTAGRWQAMSSPTTEKLNRVNMLSAGEGWIVGANGTVLHDRAGVWASVAVPDLANSAGPPEFFDVALPATRSGWLLGEGFLLTYSREVWSLIPPKQIMPPNNFDAGLLDFYSIAMLSPTDGWIVGSYGDSSLIVLHLVDGIWGT